METSMTSQVRKLARPPIIEAVIDIDCDLPPDLRIESLEDSAKEIYGPDYPKFKTRHLWKQKFEMKGGGPPTASTRGGLDGYQLLHEDGKQLVQVRTRGYSFNRLTPYSTLEHYLPEIERTWSRFVRLAHPIKVVSVRLRYINKMDFELRDGHVNLAEYLKLGPRLPDESRLSLMGFLNQYQAVESETGHQVKAILTTQKPDAGKLPIIFDITAESDVGLEPDDWNQISQTLHSLRDLKNRVFYNTLEEKCLQLFQ